MVTIASADGNYSRGAHISRQNGRNGEIITLEKKLCSSATQIMTPLDSVYMLPMETVLDFETITGIYDSGYRSDGVI